MVRLLAVVALLVAVGGCADHRTDAEKTREALGANESAYPNKFGATGITLRDYFASQALVGLVSRPSEGDHFSRANLAYAYADAMLAERSKTP